MAQEATRPAAGKEASASPIRRAAAELDHQAGKLREPLAGLQQVLRGT